MAGTPAATSASISLCTSLVLLSKPSLSSGVAAVTGRLSRSIQEGMGPPARDTCWVGELGKEKRVAGRRGESSPLRKVQLLPASPRPCRKMRLLRPPAAAAAAVAAAAALAAAVAAAVVTPVDMGAEAEAVMA